MVDIKQFKKLKAEKKQQVVNFHQRIFFIHGEKGSGKSTMASRFSRPFFIDFEDRLKDVKLPDGTSPDQVQVYSWKEAEDWAKFFAEHPPEETGTDTIVVDGIKTGFQHMVADILKQYRVTGINEGALAYGNGKGIVTRMFEEWFLDLRKAVANGYGVVITSQDRVLSFKNGNVEMDKRIPLISGGSKDDFGWEAIKPFPDMVIYVAKEQTKEGVVHMGYLKGTPLIEASSSNPPTHALPNKIPFTYAALEAAWNGEAASSS